MFELQRGASVARLVTALVGGLSLAFAAQAAPVSYNGTFLADNELAIFASLDITSAAGGTISAQTFSYAAGGFIPALVLFDGSGSELQRITATSSACGGPPYCFDVGFGPLTLGMGSYTLVLSQDGNLPNTGVLADGYIYTDGASVDPNFTSVWALPGSPAANFVQFADGVSRTGNWGLTIDVVNNAVSGVPEPTSLALVLAALGATAAARRRLAA
jgi:hypothetical protein